MDRFQERDLNKFIQDAPFSGWQLIKLYWQSRQSRSAYFFSVLIIIMTISVVVFEVVFNYWYNYFYNALQAYDVDGCMRLVVVFCGLAFFYIILQVYLYYVTQLFSWRWRRWLTNHLVARWLCKRGYYYLETFDNRTDNPDQRIQEDIQGIVASTVGLTVGLIKAVTTFPAFVYILWRLSGVLTIPLGSLGTIHIYGYLVWVSILYNLIGTFLTFKIGFPLVNLNFEQQRREATFRYAAVDLRVHAENVALYRGEHHQEVILKDLFKRVLDNWYAIILRQKKLLWFTGGFNQTAVLLPLLAALPNYFKRVFQLGGLMQSLRAFGSIQESLSYLVNAYTEIAQWRAITQRLVTFLNHLNESEQRAQNQTDLTIENVKQDKITANELTITVPNGDVLLKNINQTFEHGKNYVIHGRSGLGKSTFVRVLAGIWPYATGSITLPNNKHIMFLPQKAYMPIGTLEEAILFPDKNQPELQEKIPQVLRDCHLEHLIPKLNEIAHWSEQLSPGEQQRVAFARVLLHKPDWVFLDESTSMLDLSNEKHLYELLAKELPKCSVVSVGHHPSVDKFHDHVVNMEKFG